MNRYISFLSAAGLLFCMASACAADHPQRARKSQTVPGVSPPVIPPTAPAVPTLQAVIPVPQIAVPPAQAVIMPTDPVLVPTDPVRIPASQ